MTIFVGNLSHQAKENELEELFSEFGEVSSVKIIKDFETGKSKGFAFVEMADEAAASEAIESLNETEFLSRTIVVNKAKPREKSPAGGGGGNRGGGNYGRNKGGYGGGGSGGYGGGNRGGGGGYNSY